MAEAAPVEETKKRTWAEEDDDAGADDDDVEIGGSTVAQVGAGQTAAAEGEEAAAAEQQKPRTIVQKKSRQNRERNIYGDFIVTKINIKEREIPVQQQEAEEEEEESEEESEEEEQPPEQEPEEVKKGKYRAHEMHSSREDLLHATGESYFLSACDRACQNSEQEGAEAPRGRGVRQAHERGRP